MDPLNTAPVTTMSSPHPAAAPSADYVHRRVPLDFLIALILLVAIIIGLAIFTAVESKKIAEETNSLNLAGRQRMLSERQAKLLYRVGIGHSERNPIDKAEALRDLKKTHALFHNTLQAFSVGGDAKGLDGETDVTIDPVEGTKLRGIISRTEDLWDQYTVDTAQLLSTRLSKIDDAIIVNSTDATREVNEPLLNLSSELAQTLEDSVAKRSTTLQRVQQLGVLGAILLLGYIAMRVIRNLKSAGDSLQENLKQITNTNNQLANAQNELAQNAGDLQSAYQSLQTYNTQMEQTTHQLHVQQEESESIFSAVSEGLCLIDQNCKIGSQVSDEMYEIFETDNLSERSLIDLMRPLITERDLRSLESYLELQFDPATSETQLEKYNPLKKTEVTLDWDGGGFSTKNLGFKFQRVYTEDDQIASVLVTVNDVTETVRLENELARANESRERQTELIFEVIESDPKELNLFLKKSEATLNDINEELEAARITDDSAEDGGRGKKLVASIFNKVHNIKGNASLLGLKSVVDTASTVEEKLGVLRSKSSFKGDELLTSLVELAYMRELLNEFDELRTNTFANFKPKKGNRTAAADSSRTGILLGELSKLANTIGQEHGKEVSINANGLDLNDLPSTQFEHTKDLLIQLVRNSIVHGIEEPAEREEYSKWIEGSIQIKSEKDDSTDNALGKPCYELAYRDDGRGIDPQVIGQRALDLELITKEEFEKMGTAQLSALIFDHGFSSVDVSDDHAGRGAGMGLIRNIVNKELSGKLRMTYETDEYLEFTILIPQQLTSENAKDQNKEESKSAKS